MSKKNKKKKKILTEDDKLKLEIAEELGLLDKINYVGWGRAYCKGVGANRWNNDI